METESISVGELLNDPANVRQHGARNLETIKASLARFGQQKPIVVDGNGVVVAGNGTLAAARELGWQEVHVVRSGLTGSDRTAYAIADNRTAELAEWDEGALAEQLSALAIDDEELLAAAGYDPGELEALADAVVGGGGDQDSNYTRKVETPIYEPTGPKPDVSELWDNQKSSQLVRRLSEQDLDEQLKDFFTFAAYRHTEFNFTKIAEFYAHSDAETQQLFEDSALVIVDFDKAIEAGFVKMTNAMQELMQKQAKPSER